MLGFNQIVCWFASSGLKVKVRASRYFERVKSIASELPRFFTLVKYLGRIEYGLPVGYGENATKSIFGSTLGFFFSPGRPFESSQLSLAILA